MISDFSVNLGRWFNRLLLALIFILSLPVFSVTDTSVARSAYNPRHTGMDPPGGPKRLDNMPSHSPSRTAEGGMGYTDAYGNTIRNHEQLPKERKNRLRSGAYGNYDKKPEKSVLPDPGDTASSPVWNFK